MKKVSLIAAAVTTALFAGSVAADEKPDGWEVHGYASMNYRMIDGETVDTEFGRPDYRTAGTSGQSTNQVEFTIKKHTNHDNGVWSDFVVRTEYGNGNSFAYSSEGSQKNNTKAQFEVKESFVEIGGLSYIGKDSSIWGGQRFLNRAAGIISGEFWKQSSGVGAGFQTKIADNTFGVAIVSADINSDINNGVNKDRQTITTHDMYYYGVKALGGSFDFDLKYIKQANQNGDSADDGFGGSITYNRDYYGFDGWSQTGIAYGEGAASNRGVNTGSWSGDFTKDSTGLFITSYGVANITDKVQLGTEFVYMANDEFYGQEDITRILFAARPSYKVNDNFRLELTGAIASEQFGTPGAWGQAEDEYKYYTAEAAAVFTVNADYFGRPQIKPYITYVAVDDKSGSGNIGINDYTSGKSQTIVGVHTEIWF